MRRVAIQLASQTVKKIPMKEQQPTVRGLARELEQKYRDIQRERQANKKATFTTRDLLSIANVHAYQQKILRQMNWEAKSIGEEGRFTLIDADHLSAVTIRLDINMGTQHGVPNQHYWKLKHYSIEQIVRDFVRTRSAMERKNVPFSEAELLYRMLHPYFKGNNLALRRLIQSNSGGAVERNVFARKMIRFNPRKFFERIRKDEKEKRNTANQQTILEHHLEESLTYSTEMILAVNHAIHEMESPSATTLSAARKRVRNFDERDPAVQTRIIQEEVMRRLGDQLATHFIEIQTGLAERRPSPVYQELGEWIMSSIKLKENKQFLARRAVEIMRPKM